MVIDPFLTGNPLADIGHGDWSDLDAVLATPGHGDHRNTNFERYA